MSYSVKIKEASKELTAKERLLLKDTTNALKIDEATQTAPLIIKPAMYAILDIHNEKSDNKDYENYIVVDTEGNAYVTGSASFWKSFIDIYTEMQGSNEEYAIKVYRRPSTNYKGKEFITCTVV